ncbi:hypothetical protein [Egicoccus sp. AB-alg6-2]|uniref:hypothetical protein n=1 Tax=Egicoccus sp. AB-alg6-2 TaxID=3242692 RepID=UPI00359E5FBE
MDLTAVDPLVWIILAVVVVAVLVVMFFVLRKKRRKRDETRRHLKDRFGSEYDRTVSQAKNRRAAEEELLARERRRQSFEVRPVPADQREGLRARWDEIQSSFVDAPHATLRKADELLDEVAVARGYPDAAREQRLADLSVDHPAAVERYCSSRPDSDKDDQSTEQLRAALLASRDLFETMLNQGEPGSTDTPPTPFQELVTEEPVEGETSARAERHGAASNGHEDGTIDLTPHDRRREHVDTGGMAVTDDQGRPLPPPPADGSR